MVEFKVPSERLILFTIVVISILLSASASFLNVVNGFHLDKAISCQAEYNELDGTARDERAGVSVGSLKADLKAWQRLKKLLTRPPTNDAEARERLLTAFNDKIEAIKLTQNTQAKNPYPAPDACKDGEISKEEGNINK